MSDQLAALVVGVLAGIASARWRGAWPGYLVGGAIILAGAAVWFGWLR